MTRSSSCIENKLDSPPPPTHVEIRFHLAATSLHEVEIIEFGYKVMSSRLLTINYIVGVIDARTSRLIRVVSNSFSTEM